ncbi:MAG: lysoplasmalogenase [Eubacterium sp.]|nr:lysoplasmalogenase [Eubacterium sp.]
MWVVVFPVLLVLDIIVACIYAKHSFPDTDKRAFLEKMLASSIFVLSGVIAYWACGGDTYSKLIISALVCGIIGDALLSCDPFFSEKNKKKGIIVTTIVGAAFFLLGHALYIVAFIKEIKRLEAFRLPVFLAVLFLGIGVAVGATLILKLKPGKIGPPMLVYVLGLSAMGALSINLALFGYRGAPLLQFLLVIAPIMFMTSDATLGLKFSDNDRFSTAKMRYLTLLTYYPAQMIFSVTIVLRVLYGLS